MTKSVVWWTSMACNFKCRYCWEVQAQERGEFKPIPFKPASEWLTVWNRLKPALLDITGGEPFLMPDFVDLLVGLDPGIQVGLTSNLSHSLLDFVRLVSPDRVVSIDASFHPTENGTRQHPMNPEVFVGRCLFLQNRGFRVTVNCVAWPEQLYLIPAWAEMFRSNGLRFQVDPYASIADVLCHRSDDESHCFSINETWLAGVPVVSCDYLVNRLFEKRHGPLLWIVPVRTEPATLAEAIDEAYVERSDPRVQHAREVAAKEYSAQSMGQRWSDLIGTLTRKY